MKQINKQFGFKRGNMPLWGENALNFWLRIVYGGLLFWILYYPYFHADHALSYLEQVSYIMLFSLLASIFAMLLAYFTILVITKKLRRPKKGFFSLNRFPDLQSVLYELLAVTINAGLMATGLILFLQQQTQTWEQFFLLYLAMKLISRLIAFSLAIQMSKNLLLTFGFLAAFAALLSVALMQLTHVEVFPKT